ncbi:hypothetical protein MAR_029341 [Mya arenaria]|uniref:Uncharacterized protein n=1 Tax=Mya arenaria TaxID=6604 RepID=A0ABY7DJI9_MYAAR|nr:uncharacterized protein LOC128219996 [Mya arenaria]XP_052786306.1 uncharacterized protein LOC128221741 [Mya arenaria]WAQ96649.1 hypothetical protein MAR_029339 [Mya arenaria]WAQ96651.1 hypothetical protein MAR_029341 [Mya arenaria]
MSNAYFRAYLPISRQYLANRYVLRKLSVSARCCKEKSAAPTSVDKRKGDSSIDILRDKPFAFMSQMQNNPDKFSYEKTFFNPYSDRWKYEPYVVSVCAVTFLVYFMFLRKSSYLDEELQKPLFETFPSLEKETLKALVQQNQRSGVSTKKYEAKLEVVEQKLDTLKQNNTEKK